MIDRRPPANPAPPDGEVMDHEPTVTVEVPFGVMERRALERLGVAPESVEEWLVLVARVALNQARSEAFTMDKREDLQTPAQHSVVLPRGTPPRIPTDLVAVMRSEIQSAALRDCSPKLGAGLSGFLDVEGLARTAAAVTGAPGSVLQAGQDVPPKGGAS